MAQRLRAVNHDNQMVGGWCRRLCGAIILPAKVVAQVLGERYCRGLDALPELVMNLSASDYYFAA